MAGLARRLTCFFLRFLRSHCVLAAEILFFAQARYHWLDTKELGDSLPMATCETREGRRTAAPNSARQGFCGVQHTGIRHRHVLPIHSKGRRRYTNWSKH